MKDFEQSVITNAGSDLQEVCHMASVNAATARLRKSTEKAMG